MVEVGAGDRHDDRWEIQMSGNLKYIRYGRVSSWLDTYHWHPCNLLYHDYQCQKSRGVLQKGDQLDARYLSRLFHQLDGREYPDKHTVIVNTLLVIVIVAI